MGRNHREAQTNDFVFNGPTANCQRIRSDFFRKIVSPFPGAGCVFERFTACWGLCDSPDVAVLLLAIG
jgi:hypothetical protein